MEKSILTFNDLPEVVAQLRDEVMSLKSLLAEQRSVNNAKTVDTHVPMSVDEAAEYLGIPKGTLYMKLSEGTIPATKPGKRYCLYRAWWQGLSHHIQRPCRKQTALQFL